MKKINPKTINPKDGYEFLDLIRDGWSTDLDSMKVSALLTVMVDRINALTEAVVVLQKKKK